MKRTNNRAKPKIRVMLVDDHSGMREALRTIIDSHPQLALVAEADDGQVALDLLNQVKTDVVLMDGSMPGMNGIETTKRMTKRRSAPKVIGLTLYAETTYLEEMVAAGARGYVLKTSAPDNLVHAIQIVAAGKTYFDPAVPRRSAAVANHSQPIEKLSADELAVLKRLANGETNNEIATSLGLSVTIVDQRRVAAMKKLGLRTRVELIRLATSRGWLET